MAQQLRLIPLVHEMPGYRDAGDRLGDGFAASVGRLWERDHPATLPERRFAIQVHETVVQTEPERIRVSCVHGLKEYAGRVRKIGLE